MNQGLALSPPALPAGLSPGQILAERVKIVYGMQAPSALVTLTLSVIVALVLQDFAPQVWAWLALQATLKLMTLAIGRWFFDPAEAERNPSSLYRLLFITEPMGAVGWASLLWVLQPGVTPFQLAFVVMALCGVLSGGVTNYGALPSIHAAYIGSFVTVSLASYFYMRELHAENYFVYITPLLLCLYCIGVFVNTRTSGRAYSRFITLGFANAQLAKELENEVKRAERALEDAKAANVAKTTFLASASHDLRQPIHAAGLFVALLDRTHLDGRQREILGNIRNALRASSEMLDTLLDFSRAEAGVIVPKPQVFAIDDLLSSIEAELGIEADRKGIAFRVRESGVQVRSDPALVRLILLNLVSNAIRYTREGAILVACRRRGASLLVEVWDTGIGIPAEEQQAIFADFTQIGNPERDRRKGLGLGLAITRRLADLLGTEVTLASRPGKGSVFRFALPVAEQGLARAGGGDGPSARPAAAAFDLPDGRRRRVLVLDDDPAILEGISALLAGGGYLVATAEDVDTALHSAAVSPPDLLICDLRLREGRDGIEAARLIRERCGARLPVLLITGDTHPDRMVQAAREDVEILYKPVELPAIVRKAEALLAKSAPDAGAPPAAAAGAA